jgi:hypothetical protein
VQKIHLKKLVTFCHQFRYTQKKNMKSILVCLFSLLALQISAQTVINDKNVEVRKIGSFSAIKVSGGIDVYLSQGNEDAVGVSASDPEYRDNIRTEVKNGVLNIYYDNNSIRLRGNKRLRAYISFKNIEGIEGSGACNFIITGTLTGASVKVKLSGACEMKGIVNISDVQFDLSGASTISVSGKIANLKLEASGASDLKNYELTVGNLIAQLSGASDAKLTVNKSISATASGASNLYFKGNPEVRKISSNGASNISSKE